MIKALYHPKFEPDENWLRAMLLFYETIYSIVPEEAGYTPSPRIAALQDKAPEAFVPLVPTQEDRAYEWGGYHALVDVLSQLPPEGGDRNYAHLDRSDLAPRLELGESVRIHHDKMADMLVNDLIRLGRAEKMDEKWLRVDQRVADLVVSMLADSMAQNNRGVIYTSSDREQSWAVAAKGQLERSRRSTRRWNPEATLASAVLTVEIPDGLADLPLNRYLDVRKRYEDQRHVFHLAMRDLSTLYLKGGFETPRELRDDLEAAVAEFGRGMQKLRKPGPGGKVHRWAPIALGGIVQLTAAALSVPALDVGAAGTSLTLQVLAECRGGQVAVELNQQGSSPAG